jgi:predicted Zn-dependent protease
VTSVGSRAPDVGFSVSPATRVVGAVLGVAVVGLAAWTLSRPTTFSTTELDALTKQWLAHGAWGTPRNDEVVAAVNAVGETVLTPVVDRVGKRKVRFVVLRDATAARAAALPDGTIVVTTGALRRLDSEAQLAALLSHAVAHLLVGDVDTALAKNPGASAARRALETSNPQDAAVLIDEVVVAPAADETRATALTIEMMRTAGWSTTAISELFDRMGASGGLPATEWSTLHPVDESLQRTLTDAKADGRVNKTEYASGVLDRVGRRRRPTAATSP